MVSTGGEIYTCTHVNFVCKPGRDQVETCYGFHYINETHIEMGCIHTINPEIKTPFHNSMLMVSELCLHCIVYSMWSMKYRMYRGKTLVGANSGEFVTKIQLAK